MAAVDEQGYLALRDRAHALLLQIGAVAEETLLAHVYGGLTPPALRTQLSAPLVGDPRLQRLTDGRWTLRGGGEAGSISSAAAGPGGGRFGA